MMPSDEKIFEMNLLPMPSDEKVLEMNLLLHANYKFSIVVT